MDSYGPQPPPPKEMTPEEKAAAREAEEDEYFEQLLKGYQAGPQSDIDDDIEYFKNHPLTCKELTPEMLDKPEFKALQNLAYDGTPEEVCRNFMHHAMDALDNVAKKYTKGEKHDQVECDRAMHFFNEAFKTGWKEYQMQFTLYMGRAKLNLLIAQFKDCKEDCLAALKIKSDHPGMWNVLCRSRFFVEKWQEGLKYANQGLAVLPTNEKLLHWKKFFEAEIAHEKMIAAQVETLKEDEKLPVYRVLRANRIKMGKKLQDVPADVNLNITLDDYKKLHFPVLLLYDEFMTTDFIQDWEQDVTLRQALGPVFQNPLPWDQDGDYTMQTIEVYFEADQTKCLDPREQPKKKSTKKYIKCNLNDSIMDIVCHANYIVPQFPILKIISNDSDFKESFLNEI